MSGFRVVGFFFLLMVTACHQLALPYPLPQPSVEVVAVPSPSPEVLKQLPATWTPQGEVLPARQDTPSPPGETDFSVWVLNEDDHAILRIGHQSQKIEHKIVINGIPLDVAVDERAVWVIEGVDESRSNILRIDRQTNVVVASIPIIYGAALSLTTGEGAVWVGIAEPTSLHETSGGIEYTQSGGVMRIDAQTNQITHYIKTGAVAAEVVYYQRALWVLEWMFLYSYVDRIDLASKDFVIRSLPETPDMDEYLHQFGHIAVNHAGIWATPLEDNTEFIYRMNAEDGKIESFIQVGDSAADILATEDSIWVALRGGTVLRIEPSGERITEAIKTGGRLSNLYLNRDVLWALSRMDAQVYSIDLTNRGVSQGIMTGNVPKPRLTPSPTPPPLDAGDTPWHPCSSGYESKMRVGMQAMVNPDPPLANRVRDDAGRQATVIGQIEPGEIVEILAGPLCADNWVWWKIKSVDTGLSGWTAEGDGSNYWLIPIQ